MAWLGRRHPALRALQQLAGLAGPAQSAAYSVFRSWQPASFLLMQRAGWSSEAAEGPAAGGRTGNLLSALKLLPSHLHRIGQLGCSSSAQPAPLSPPRCRCRRRQLAALPASTALRLPIPSAAAAAAPVLDPKVDPAKGFVRGGYSVASFSPDRIRNFSIIAHVSVLC